jgi:hypothetical protein
VASGTQTATVGTEHTLRDETGNEGEIFDAVIDLGNMAAGDTTEIRLYVKALSSGTLRLLYYSPFSGVQSEPIVYVPALTVMKEWKLTLKQTAGTGRNYDWTIYK